MKFSISQKQKITLGAYLTLGLLILLSILVMSQNREIFFESQESKSLFGNPVFNKIKFLSLKDKDVWMMNQSHHGSKVAAGLWDRLAIVIDKNQEPKRATFYQLAPGKLEWQENLPQIKLKVDCSACHANGLRAIRPNWSSPLNPAGMLTRLQVLYFNFKIKSYGRVFATNDFKSTFNFLNSNPSYKKLNVKTCNLCHKENGFLARGELTSHNLGTILFMLSSGNMPPLGITLNASEKAEIEKFIAN